MVLIVDSDGDHEITLRDELGPGLMGSLGKDDPKEGPPHIGARELSARISRPIFSVRTARFGFARQRCPLRGTFAMHWAGHYRSAARQSVNLGIEHANFNGT